MPNPPATSRYPDLYIRGGDIYFQVDRFLFRVHSHFFIRESDYWKHELVGPTPANGDVTDEPLKRGNSSTGPIQVKDVLPVNFEYQKPAHFARFLWIFYNSNYDDFSKAKLVDWIIILRYAAHWEFPKAKQFATTHVEHFQMDPIQKLRLYQDCKVDEKYIFPLYTQLASREEMIGLNEAHVLGMETTVLLLQARERLRGQGSASSSDPPLSPVRAGTLHSDIVEIVASTFKIPLSEVVP